MTIASDTPQQPAAHTVRATAAHRASSAGGRATRAGKVINALAPGDGTHPLITGYTAARGLLVEAIADLDTALAALKTLRKSELLAAAEETPFNDERPAG